MLLLFSEKYKIIEIGRKFSFKMWIFFFVILGRFFRCVRCSIVYYIGDFCIVVGSENFFGYNIVCSKYF